MRHLAGTPTVLPGPVPQAAPPAPVPSPRTAARILVELLHRRGVSHTFGIPGGVSIPIFDALVDSPIHHVLTRHEQGATHMADGYARATGRAGVVLATSGPGATNTVTGIMTAQMDSVPMVVLTGQTATANLGLDAFQETDVSGVTYPLVKHSYLVRDARELPRIIDEAFYLAESGRPGPVLVDLPQDVLTSPLEPGPRQERRLGGYRVAEQVDPGQILRAAQLLSRSSRPVLLVGHGAVISGAEEAVIALAEKLQAPVANTLLGKGCFPETHPLSLGMLGMHGTAYANKAVEHCDLIMSIGSRWDDRIVGKLAEFCPQARKIHVDIDASEIGKVVQVDCGLVGDARRVVESLVQLVRPGDTAEWLQRVEGWKRRFPLDCPHHPRQGGLRAQAVVQELYRLTKGQAIIATDVGQHQMWAAQFCKVDRRFHWLSSGGAGTMGFGLPAAIGAQLARPAALVVAIVGDGGFQMTMAELATAMNERLPIKVIIINNRCLGMVRQWQNLFYDNRLSGVDLKGSPDFVKLAQSYGCRAFRVRRGGEVRRVLSAALRYSDGPCLVDAQVEREDNVFPMVPAGAGLGGMLLGPSDGRAGGR